MLSGSCLVRTSPTFELDWDNGVVPSPALFGMLKTQLGSSFHYEGAPKPYDVYTVDDKTLVLVSTNDICKGSADPAVLLKGMISHEVVLKISPPPILPSSLDPIYLKAWATCELDYPAVIAILSA